LPEKVAPDEEDAAEAVEAGGETAESAEAEASPAAK